MELQNPLQALVRKSKLIPLLEIDGLYHVKDIRKESERIKVHRLRHRVFCEELGWVSITRDALEVDAYDDNAIFIAVFDQHNELKACLRVTLSTNHFMLEKEFPYLLGQDEKIRKSDDTIEISRLCVAPEARTEKISGNFGIHSLSLLLYKGLYRWCMMNRIRFLYLVVEEKVFRLFCASGFPCKMVRQPKEMPDGGVAAAAMLDWREFEVINNARRPKLFAWFSPAQSYLSSMQLPQPEVY